MSFSYTFAIKSIKNLLQAKVCLFCSFTPRGIVLPLPPLKGGIPPESFTSQNFAAFVSIAKINDILILLALNAAASKIHSEAEDKKIL